MHQIKDLFEDAGITFPTSEHFHLISHYRSGLAGFPETGIADHVLFLTDNLIFKVCRKFIAVKQILDGGKEDFKIYFKAHRPDFEITQYANCLFVMADECDPVSPKILIPNKL